MAEYIEREATCEDCVHYGVCYHIEHYGRDIETDEPCEKFKPAADEVEVRHGSWVRTNVFYGFYMCSNCRSTQKDCQPLYNKVWHYCPNCGADMRGERKCEDG